MRKLFIPKRYLTASVTFLSLLTLFIAVIVISQHVFKNACLDLTENHIYTVSPGTRRILANLKEPVIVRFYFSKRLATALPQVYDYAHRIKELLEQYQNLAHGKLILQKIDPEPFSEQEDEAMDYGLKGVPIDNQGSAFYFGLVVTGPSAKVETIPLFQLERESLLEYDITRAIDIISRIKQKKIGVLSSLPLQGSPYMNFMGKNHAEPWIIWEQLKQGFDLQPLSNTLTKIPDDIDVLLLINPKTLSQQTIAAIDRYAVQGGHILGFIDNFSEVADSANPGGSPFPQNTQPLTALLSAWGVNLVPNTVVADLNAARKVRYMRDNHQEVIQYPLWVDLDATYIDQNDPITAHLDSITLATPSELTRLPTATSKITPLITSDTNAMAIPVNKIAAFTEHPDDLLNTYKGDNIKHWFAVRITGRIKPAFSQNTNLNSHPANIILVADSDMLYDEFWAQSQYFMGERLVVPNSGNGNFVNNAVDNLSGSNDLISIRNRHIFNRPFTRMVGMQQIAEDKFREKEQSLLKSLEATQEKLRILSLQTDKGSTLLLTKEKQNQIATFRKEMLNTRKALRNIQHNLQAEITHLQNMLILLNVLLMPMLVLTVGVVFYIFRHRNRGRSYAAKPPALRSTQAQVVS